MGGIIELKDVTKIYSTKDTPEIIALNKANLTVEEGEFLSEIVPAFSVLSHNDPELK